MSVELRELFPQSARQFGRELFSTRVNRWYGDLDPRSIRVAGQLWVQERPTSADLRLVRYVVAQARRTGRQACTLQRSGSNVLLAAVNTAINIRDGGSGSFHYVDASSRGGEGQWLPDGEREWWPGNPAALLLAARHHRGRPLPRTPFVMSHFPNDAGVIRPWRARPVVLVREPRAAISSLLHHNDLDPVDPDPAARDKVIRLQIQWLNWWGDELERLRQIGQGRRVLLLRYERLATDLVGTLAEVGEHWDLCLPAEVTDRAAELCSLEAMQAMARFDPANKRVRVGRRADLSDEVIAQIDRALQVRLRHWFGYADGS